MLPCAMPAGEVLACEVLRVCILHLICVSVRSFPSLSSYVSLLMRF